MKTKIFILKNYSYFLINFAHSESAVANIFAYLISKINEKKKQKKRQNVFLFFLKFIANANRIITQ